MKEPLILTIDVGTQSVRVALFNKTGDTIGIVKKAYNPPYISKKEGMAEQDPDFYFKNICLATKELKKNYGDRFQDIIGVAMDTIRDTSVILDENFKPLHPSIVWLDQRLSSGKRKQPLSRRILIALSGQHDVMFNHMRRSISLWYIENEPIIWSNTRHYGNISSYLTYKLTGEWKDSPASMIGHYPLDFPSRTYISNPNYVTNVFEIPLAYLPELVPVGNVLGHINKTASEASGIPEGTPLYSCGSDKSCESLGLGAVVPDVAAISYGTASTIEVTTKKYHNSEGLSPAYPSCIPGYHNLDVQIYRGYWMINWFVKNFCNIDPNDKAEFNGIIKELNHKMLEIPPGSDGLILQPFWQPGLLQPRARGSIIGFTGKHTNLHIYRAIIEGIAFALRQALDHFERKTHKHVNQIMISGGGSNSDEICQITANIFGLPVSRVQTFETSSLGASIAGFLAAKEFDTPEEAVNAMVHKKDTFQPDMAVYKIYNKLYHRAYKKVYGKLKKIYQII